MMRSRANKIMQESTAAQAQGRTRWLAQAGLYLLPLVLFLLALGLRGYRLEAQSLWLDEGSTWQTIGLGWSVLLADLFQPFAAYPLYHLLLKAWVAVAGDSEWALRFPSVLSGAGAVVAIFFAARELQGGGRADAERSNAAPAVVQLLFPSAAALLLLLAPFAIWYSQEAKVYSLLLLISTLLLWSFFRAVQRATRREWLICAALSVSSVFVHRLALLLLVALFAAWLLTRARLRSSWLLPLLLLPGVAIVAAMAFGLGSDRAATGAYIPADPLLALWLTFVRFSIDRWPGDAPWWWLLPWIGLSGWGVFTVLRTALGPTTRLRDDARMLLCLLLLPLALFSAQLLFTRLYEARYLLLLFPVWVLMLAYPLCSLVNPQRPAAEPNGKQGAQRSLALFLFAAGLVAALATSMLSLTQPRMGLFSGDPVKEQYRTALSELARRVHPDDLVVLHPAYLRPLYDYYMQRLSSDAAPSPVSFGAFQQGQEQFGPREWDTQRRAAFAGYQRSFLLIAPDHARTVDVPRPGDEYGLVGLYFQYSAEQKKWPCGIWRFNGVHLLCQESPEAYYTGEVPQPSTPTQAVFGGNLRLLGYTLKPTSAAGPGVYRAGGVLPITLFWDVNQQPAGDYSVFLHLCQDCTQPPVASDDGQPLMGYLPTSSWLPGKPARDDRAIPLPRDLPPGRYTLLLGLYRPDDPTPAGRLAVSGVGALEGNRLLLTEVEIVAP